MRVQAMNLARWRLSQHTVLRESFNSYGQSKAWPLLMLQVYKERERERDTHRHTDVRQLERRESTFGDAWCSARDSWTGAACSRR